MASRKEQKEQIRQERIERERQRVAKAQPKVDLVSAFNLSNEKFTLDELARKVFPKFDHSDKSELNMAVWEEIKRHVRESLEHYDGNWARQYLDEEP